MNTPRRISLLKTKPLIIFLLSATIFTQVNSSQTVPLEYYENQNDFSYMWWKDSIKTGNSNFAIRTSRYVLSFDYPKLAIESLIPLKNGESAQKVLYESNAESLPQSHPIELHFGLKANGVMSWCEKTSGKIEDCQLVEAGKYFQRRFINNLPELKGCDPYASGLEISSWADRLAFILKVTPESDIDNASTEMRLAFPEHYSVLLELGEAKALKDPRNGSGFVILKSMDAADLSVEGTLITVKSNQHKRLSAGKEFNSGIIIYPVAENIDSRLVDIVEQEKQPLIVQASQLAPISHPLKVVYDKDRGWHQIRLRSDNTSSTASSPDANGTNPDPLSHELNNRMERVQLDISNPSNRDKVLRLNFAKGRLVPDGANVFAVTGISAVFRDTEGNPLGIPIQLSKNWHSGGRTGTMQYFRGTWYHGLSMLTIPANSSTTIEYTSVNALWGGVPAASHAQLCLIGWGANQQWDQSAIGAWGESITYEPDLDQARAPVLDFRPLLVRSPNGKLWGWTGNMGGADFFNLTKPDGSRAWHSRMRTLYKRYGPNFTQVTYAGSMEQDVIDFEYTASIGRSDDMIRGIFKIKLNVNKDISFRDLVIFQAGAETYHFVKSHTLTYGNESGLQQQWEATIGKDDRYITPKKIVQGRLPWFSFTDSEFSPSRDGKFLPANRGFVIRKWNARINGQDNTPPWFAEYNAIEGHGESSGLINITAPEECHRLQAGDSIEAEIVLFIVPASAKDYYGPNENFQKALSEHANSWEMVYREAVGNDLKVDVLKGVLIDDYPISIRAENNQAQFSVKGGLGYVPLTIENVTNYRNPQLFHKVGGEWQRIDQSIHGKDFWQSEYDVVSGTWDITYNVNLDTSDDVRRTVQFKFVGG